MNFNHTDVLRFIADQIGICLFILDVDTREVSLSLSLFQIDRFDLSAVHGATIITASCGAFTVVVVFV